MNGLAGVSVRDHHDDDTSKHVTALLISVYLSGDPTVARHEVREFGYGLVVRCGVMRWARSNAGEVSETVVFSRVRAKREVTSDGDVSSLLRSRSIMHRGRAHAHSPHFTHVYSIL